MKKYTVIILLLFNLIHGSASAQTWREWFKQGKTQSEYHAKQIALLKLYVECIKEGVSIVRNGLRTIENVKNGDFNLHRDFFNSLKNVNPHIANSAKAADIIAFQIFIIQELKKINDFCKDNKNFSPEEIRYVADVYLNMLVLSDASIEELLTIIKPDKTIMTDDERLQRIDKLYDETTNRHAFVKIFRNETLLLDHQREAEKRDIKTLLETYGMTDL